MLLMGLFEIFFSQLATVQFAQMHSAWWLAIVFVHSTVSVELCMLVTWGSSGFKLSGVDYLLCFKY
jgi:hypothetical protein